MAEWFGGPAEGCRYGSSGVSHEVKRCVACVLSNYMDVMWYWLRVPPCVSGVEAIADECIYVSAV